MAMRQTSSNVDVDDVVNPRLLKLTVSWIDVAEVGKLHLDGITSIELYCRTVMDFELWSTFLCSSS